MTIAGKNQIPQEIVKESVLINLAAAYSHAAKALERKTKCSQTRGYILATLRGGVALNSNQIATRLNLDRTVVHRAIKNMIGAGLISERKANSGRALLVRLTAKGNTYRDFLIRNRRALDEKLAGKLTASERSTLLRLLEKLSTLPL
ncbi:MAG TPA: MarR family winged helix-turn-helix transcriptional regulator [Candidatus Acidoferrales bacterium]